MIEWSHCFQRVIPNANSTCPDVRFFGQLLEHLTNQFDIDRRRVYLMGMSNGASFVQLLAFSRRDDIAAIVAHSGPRPRGVPAIGAPLPIMLIVGDNDPALSAMRADADSYRARGRIVELIVVPGLGHEWCERHNPRMWRFLSGSWCVTLVVQNHVL